MTGVRLRGLLNDMLIRIPKNQNQRLFGGNTYSKCQTELDKYGDIIS